MKKLMIVFVFLTVALFSVNAQGFYFDIGAGIGFGGSSANHNHSFSISEGNNKTDTKYTVTSFDYPSGPVIDLGTKIGYGPNENLPLYFVITINQFWFQYIMGYDHFNEKENSGGSGEGGSIMRTYIFGLGIIYYPIPLLQLAGSVGFSIIADTSEIALMYGSKRGFAYELSLAVDLGRKNSGCLIGVKYFNAINTLESSSVLDQHHIGLFVRYTYRNKSSINN